MGTHLAGDSRLLLRCACLSYFLFLPGTTAAQGDRSALGLSSQFTKQVQHKLNTSNAMGLSDTAKVFERLLREYEDTGKTNEAVAAKITSSGIAAEANLAMLGTASVKPGLMTSAKYQKRDYLRFSAQLIFGDTSSDPALPDKARILFVPEASKYALSLLGDWRPRYKGGTAKQFVLSAGFAYARKEFQADPAEPPIATGTIQAHVGVEYIIFREQLSIYVNGSVLSNQENIEEYGAVFGAGAKRTFLYWSPGFRARFSDTLFVDFEAMILTQGIKDLRQSDDGLLPLFRIGFSRSLVEF